MRRGLENIVGAVLLIAIVCSMALLLYATLARYQNSLIFSLKRSFNNVNFEIVAVKYNSTGVVVYVLNSGKLPVKLIYAELLNATTETLYDNCEKVLNIVIKPGEQQSFSIKCSLISGSYIVKVFSSTGQYRIYEVYVSS